MGETATGEEEDSLRSSRQWLPVVFRARETAADLQRAWARASALARNDPDLLATTDPAAVAGMGSNWFGKNQLGAYAGRAAWVTLSQHKWVTSRERRGRRILSYSKPGRMLASRWRQSCAALTGPSRSGGANRRERKGLIRL